MKKTPIQLTIQTSPNEVEIVNFILAQAVRDLTRSELIRANLGISMPQVRKVEAFREKLIEEFLKLS